jgi:hypothetical protein
MFVVSSAVFAAGSKRVTDLFFLPRPEGWLPTKLGVVVESQGIDSPVR